MKGKKIVHIVLAIMLVLLSVLPAPMAQAASISTDTLGDTPAAWPTAFSPYKKADGSGIYDPASDVHPDDVDITSGVGRGTGKLSSMYVASDGSNFFVRLRVKGDPYDRKGGFLSSVWLVQLGVNGEQKATIGLNGKSPHTDYVYVANENGTDVQPIYKTTGEGNKVEGTRIVPAENGQYFIDFQVPINRITEVAPEITADTAVQYFFGTSKAANLSVINKEWMDTGSNNGKSVDFSESSELKLTEQPLSIDIDGGPSKEYSNASNIMSGTTSLKTGSVSISINGVEKISRDVSDYKWSYPLDGITSVNGIYKAVVSVANGSQTANAMQDIMVSGNTGKDSITIDSGAAAVTGSKTPSLSGGYVAFTNGNNFKILVSVTESSTQNGTWVPATSASNGIWKLNAAALPNPVSGKKYYVKVKMVSSSEKETYATVDQQLTYEASAASTPVTVDITSITDAGSPFPALSGTASGAELIDVRVDGTSIEFVKPTSGIWSVNKLEKPLSVGSHTFTVIASNSTGTSAVAVKTHSVTATSLVVDNGSAVTINDSHPTLRGSTNATDNKSVSVKIGDFGPFAGTVQSGRWMIEVPDNVTIPDGTYSVIASIDGIQAVQQLTIDTKTSINIVSPADKSTTDKKRPVISGTAEPEATINFILKNKNGITAIQTIKATGGGAWSYTPDEDLAEENYTIDATASDVYGNEANAISQFTVASPVKTVKSAGQISRTVPYGTAISQAVAELGSEVEITLSDLSTEKVSVSWNSESSNYNEHSAGSYSFTGTLTMPPGVTNSSNVTAAGTITVLPAPKSSKADILTYTIDGKEAVISSDKRTIQIELPFETDISRLVSDFTLSERAAASIKSEPQISGTTSNDFTNAITYTVTAEDGTKADWTVTVTKTAQDQTAQPVITSAPIQEGDTSLSGTSEPNAKITLKLSDSTSEQTTTADSQGNWTFTGLALKEHQIISVTAIAEGKAVSTPATSTVAAKPTVHIKSAAPITEEVANGTSAEEAKKLLGSTAVVTLENGEEETVSVSWEADSTPAYNSEKAGEYIFTGTLGSLPAGVVNDKDIKVIGTVKVLPVSVKSAASVTEEVANGTSVADAEAALGATATVTLENGEEETVSVSWEADSTPTYSSTKAGKYVFTGILGSLPAGVVNDKDIKVIGTVKVLPVSVKNAAPITEEVANGTPVADAKAALGSKAEITLENGDKETVSVSWSEESNPAYNSEKAGEYVFTGTLGSLPDSVVNDKDIKVTGTVKVLPVSVKSVAPITKEVANGTPVADTKMALGSQVEITLENGDKATVPVSWNEESTPAYNSTKAGEYVFTGTFDSLSDNVVNDKNIKVTGTVKVLPVSVKNASPITEEVANGTPIADAKAALGATATVTLENGEEKTVSVSWEADSTPAYNREKAGEYIFIGTLGSLPDGVVNDKDIKVTGTVNVLAAPAFSVEKATLITKEVANGTSAEDAKAALGSEAEITLENGDKATVSVLWEAESTPAYNSTKAGEYVFTGTLGSLPDNVVNDKDIKVTGKVKVLPVSVKNTTPITKEVVNGTSAADAKAALGSEAEITLENGDKETVPVSWSEESTPAYSSTKAGEYVFTGTLGSLPESVVNDKEIEVIGKIKVLPVSVKSATPITKEVTNGTSITDAKSALGSQAEVTLENGDKATVSVSWSEESNPAYNSAKAGDYVFTGTLGSLPDNVVNDQKIKAAGTIKVLPVPVKSADPISVEVANGTSVETAKEALGSQAEVTLDNGDKAKLDVVWSENADLSYDGTKAGAYTFTGLLKQLPENIVNTNDVKIIGTVKVLAVPTVSIESAPALKKTVVEGTDFNEVKEYLGDSLIVTLAGRATANVPVTWTASDYNGSQTGSYTINGTFGEYPAGVDNKKNIKAAAAIEVVEPLKLSGSIDGAKTVTVVQAVPEAEVHLYNKDGDVVQSKNADSKGNISFKDVPPGADYYATQTVKESETTASETVNVYPKIAVRYSEGDIWESVTKPVYVMENVLGTTLKWESSDPEVLSVSAEPVSTSPSGTPEYTVTVNRPLKDTSVILTANMLFEGKQIERTFLLVVKAKDYHTEKETKTTDNEVKLEGQPITEGITVTRTTLNNTQWTQLVDKLIITEAADLGSGNVSLDFNNRSSSSTRADEQAVEMSLNALRNLSGNLTVSTPEGIFHLPKDSIGKMTESGLDLYFRIVPIRSSADQQDIVQRTKESMEKAAGTGKRVKVLDIPREIETNYKGIDTEITLPLTNIQLTEKQLANLRLLIEHTDGTEEIIVPGSNGEIVRENGKAVGLKFSITHFSTFTFFQIDDIPSSPSVPAPVEPEVLPDISIDAPADGQFVVNTVPAIKGSTKTNQQAALYLDGALLGTVMADAQGKWTYKLPATLTEGSHTIYAVVKGSKGTERKSNVVTFEFAKSKHHLHYIIGFKDGEFKPTLAVTRAQMAAMLSRNLTANQVPAAVKNTYTDTKTSWARNDIEYAGSVNIMQGFANNTFKPGQAITRAQMAAIAARWIDKQCKADPKNAPYCSPDASSITYKDVPKNHWAAQSITRISRTDIMEGFGDGTFHPEDPLTRAQAVKVLNRLFQRGPLEGVASPTFKDVPEDHWAYKEVEEAATDHWYVMKGGKEVFYKK